MDNGYLYSILIEYLPFRIDRLLVTGYVLVRPARQVPTCWFSLLFFSMCQICFGLVLIYLLKAFFSTPNAAPRPLHPLSKC